MSTESMMPPSKEETEIFERRLAMARRELEEIDEQIERELQDVRERIAALQEKRKSSLKMYDAACTMLGIDNDLEAEPESDRALG